MTLIELIDHYTPESIKAIIKEHEDKEVRT